MYTATIPGRNLRDTATGSKKLLLVNIHSNETQFRDHCWVIASQLEKFIPYQNHQEIDIQFTADISSYQVQGPAKETLTNISNIKITAIRRKPRKKKITSSTSRKKKSAKVIRY